MLLTVLLRLALLVLAPLLVAPVATAQSSASRATATTAPTGVDRAAEVDLLRPAAWLTLHGLSHGSRMPFASPELGIDGVATVVGIGRCPESAAGSEPGKRAVTGLVRRTAQNWVTVHLVGQSEPIRCTPEHPIWSKSRQRWVGAGHLEAGEELDAAGDGDEPPSGRTARAVVVERIERHASPAAVFNLEVHRAHTYRVGAGRVLVHNTDNACVKVIGKQEDTAVAADWEGHDVLNDPDWSLDKNDQWVQSGIDAKQDFYLASEPSGPNLLPSSPEYGESVFAREVRQLEGAGYTRQGDFMKDPTGQ